MNAISRRGLLASSVAVGAAGVLAGCGSSSSSSGSSASQSSGNAQLRVWFMDGSVSDDGQKYLKSQFEKDNPGSTLTIEIQAWDGILSKLQTALASDSSTPDIVELGNTQTSTFSTVGALADVTDMKSTLGGDQLIKSFLDAATTDSKIYAYPFYAGSRGIYYRTDIWSKAGITKPTTMDDFLQQMIKLQKANPNNVSGWSALYLGAANIHGCETFMFSDGGDYATQQDGKWTGQLSTDASQKSLKLVQSLFQDAGTHGLDSTDAINNSWQQFLNGKVGTIIAMGTWESKLASISDKFDVFALPGQTAGTLGKPFAGGSNVAIAAKSKQQDAARKALQVIFSETFQKSFATAGWIPGNMTYAVGMPGKFGKISKSLVENSKLTPNTPQWGVVDGDNTLKDFWTELAKGGDVATLAKNLDTKFNTVLNQSS